MKVAKALPAAGASATSDWIDLGTATPGVTLEHVDFVMAVGATPNLADAKTVTLEIEDSADEASSALVAALDALVVTGAGGVGAAAAERRVKLPPGVRRFIRLKATVEAVGGDNTAVEAELKALF